MNKIFLLLFIPLLLSAVSPATVQNISFIVLDEVGIQKKSINAPLMDCQKLCKEINKWKISIPIDKIKNWADSNLSLLKKKFDVYNSSLNISNTQIPLYKFIEKLQKEANKKDFIKNELVKNRYLIVLYLDNLDSELRVIKSRKDAGFNLISDVDLVLKAVIFQPDIKNKRFTFFKIISGESLDLDYMRNLRELYSINYFDSEFEHFPTNKFIGDVKFRQSLAKSFAQAYKTILNKFQEIKEFRTLSQIKDIHNGFVIIDDNNKTKTKIRTDSPLSFNVLRSNGSLKELAWGKIDRKNQAKIINGLSHTDVLDWSYMPYWKGYLFGTSFKYGSSTLLSKDTPIISISEYLISADVKMDLGYLLNNPLFSEIWLNFSLYSGVETTSILETEHISYLDFNSLFGIQTDLKFRKYLRKAIFLDGGLNLGAKFSEYKIGYFNYTAYDKGNLHISSFYLGVQGGGGYSFSPNLEIFADAEYILPIFGHSYIEENGKVLYENAMDYINSQDFQYDKILRFSIGMRFNY